MSDDKQLYERMKKQQNKQDAVEAERQRRRALDQARWEAREPERLRRQQAVEEKRLAEEARREELRAQHAEEQKAQEKAREKEWEESLAPRRARLKREWMIDHPTENPVVFDTTVWPLMKKNIKEDEFDREAQVAREREKLRASGRYS